MQREGQTRCIMEDVQMVNALFKKKKDFLFWKSFFNTIKISALQKKKKEE